MSSSDVVFGLRRRGESLWARTGRRLERRAGLVVASVSIGAWLLANPRTPDLAAQVYRADLFEDFGFTVWDNNWYAGHHVPGYSLVFPPVAQLVGMRGAGVLAVLVSVVLFGVLARQFFGSRATAATAFFALAATCDLWIGRLTFAMGITFGLAAVLAVARGRPWVGALLAGLCSAASPVAGLFLVLAGVAHVLGTRTLARGAALAGGAGLVALAMAYLFPEGGQEPFGAASFAAALGAALAFAVLVPRDQPVLRVAGVLNVVAVVLSLVVHSPMGSNVARLEILFAWPLLVGTAAVSWLPHRGWAARVRWPSRGTWLALAGLGLVSWTVWGPVREIGDIAGDPSTSAAYYQRVEAFLGAHLKTPARVEVPFTSSHWEDTYLGERFPLARGWERQLDVRYDPLFFANRLNEASYHAWLLALAVRYVAVSDAPLDSSSTAEVHMIDTGLPYLREVFTSSHWQVYQVLDAAPLAQGPGTVTRLGVRGFTLRADRAGRFEIRVRYTRYWTITTGRGCVSRAPGGWTAIEAAGAGSLNVMARFSVGQALGGGTTCRGVSA